MKIGKYLCKIILIDENVGELEYLINGICQYP